MLGFGDGPVQILNILTFDVLARYGSQGSILVEYFRPKGEGQ